MKKVAFVAGLAVLALTAGCEARFGKDEDPAANVPGEASAEGKSEEGQVSFKAPGIDIKVNMPEGMRDSVNSDGDLIYPGSNMSGIHVEGSSGGGGVELRFTSSDAPERLASWYRDAARTDFTISSQARQGDGFVMEGAEKDGTPFKLRLEPRNGGTEAILSLTDRN